MKNFIHFFREHKPLLLFGFLLTFFSGFGQTFLISLYVPEIARDFDLSIGRVGSVYAAATLASAFCLAKAGSLIDRFNLKTFTFFVIAGLFLSLLLLSHSNNIILLILGIWGLRLTGQGLMGHTAVTTMARHFDKVRGKAISVSTLGHPAGEALLPLMIAFTISQFGWRTSLLLTAILVVAILPLASHFLLNKRKEVLIPQQAADNKDKPTSRDFSQRKILISHMFWLLLPNIFILPFLNTAIFFYQIPLGASRGWEPEWVAGSISAFAIASAGCMVIGGPLVDRFTATRLFPFYMIPYLIGFILLLSFETRWIYPICLLLMGASNGFGSTIKNAVQAEKFDVQFLGSVRSLFSALIVISTALSPALFGVLLDYGFTFHQILLSCIFFIIFAIIYSFRLLSAFGRRRWYIFWKKTIKTDG